MHNYDKGMHQGMSSSKSTPGKAIRMTGQSWTEKPHYKGVTGKAKARHTMKNRRPQGTGHAGKAGKHVTIPKVNGHGFYPLREET